MKKTTTALLLMAGALIAACTGSTTPSNESTQRVVEDVDSATGVITLRDYEMSDTIAINRHTYSFTYSLHHVDSMNVIINPQGLEYKESRVRVCVKDGQRVVFDKTYYKNDLSAFVPDGQIESYTMVGVSYNYDKSDDRTALYFIITVGDPDEASDTAYPVELKVNTDGTSTLNKAQNLETGSLNPNLNIDPTDTDGV